VRDGNLENVFQFIKIFIGAVSFLLFLVIIRSPNTKEVNQDKIILYVAIFILFYLFSLLSVIIGIFDIFSRNGKDIRSFPWRKISFITNLIATVVPILFLMV